MKTHRVLPSILILVLTCSLPSWAQESVPDYLRIELKRLEETWNILDQMSTKIWPGWNNYTDVPFLFTYPNGVQMLVGHPKPPDGFLPMNGLEIRGKKVYLDRQKEVALAMRLPLLGGGGPVPFGMAEGRRVTVVRMQLRSTPESAETNPIKERNPDYLSGSENQILVNVHELFHCLQESLYKWKHGNLRYNNDENYATFAEIEGLALERAYLAVDEVLAKESLKDFVIARQFKRRSMNDIECAQESDEDVMEGTATYAELMALHLIKQSYKPLLTQRDDHFFYGFHYADSLIQRKLSLLRAARVSSLSSLDKCYPYGCFQAMLLNRFSPAWRAHFFGNGKALDQVIDSVLAMTTEEKEAVGRRIKDRYAYDTIYVRHSKVIGQRDRAFELVSKRQGLVFIVNLKNTGEFLSPESSQVPAKVGLINIFTHGIKRIKIADVLFEGKDTPMVIDQLYYVKWIDTEAKAVEKSYEVEGIREVGTNIYRDAVFRTSGFRLAAPRLEIREGRNRVRVMVLSKVKA